MLQLLDDEALRTRMGAYGYQRVTDQLACHYEAPRLLAAYACLLPGTRQPASNEEPSAREKSALAGRR